MPHVLSLAKELVRLSLESDEPDPLTNMRLQKLLYYAQGWSIVIRDSELFDEAIEAWEHGPVVAAVHSALPNGLGLIFVTEAHFLNVPPPHPDEAEFLRAIWESYRDYSASALRNKTREETPWKKAREGHSDNEQCNVALLPPDLEAFFKTQVIPQALAAYQEKRRQEEADAIERLAQMKPLDPDRLAAAASGYTPGAIRRR